MKKTRAATYAMKRHPGAKARCSSCGKKVRNVADHARDAHKPRPTGRAG